MNDAPVPTSAAEGCLPVTPYEPGTSCPAGAAVLMTVVLGASAVGLGWLTSYVSQWFYLLVLFPSVLGAALGLLGGVGVKLAKVRHGVVTFLIGLTVGGLVMAAAHWFDYQRFRNTAVEQLREPLKRQLGYDLATIAGIKFNLDESDLGREAAIILRQLGDESDPVSQRVRQEVAAKKSSKELLALDRYPLGEQINGDLEAALNGWAARLDFWDFLTLKAETGAAFRWKRFKLPLQDSWLWACWGLELLLAGGMAGLIMQTHRSDPFCDRCKEWKEEKELARLHLPPEVAVGYLTSGAFGQLAQVPATHRGHPLILHAASCPTCGLAGAVDFRLEKVTADAKDKETTETVAHVTASGEALTLLQPLCQAEKTS